VDNVDKLVRIPVLDDEPNSLVLPDDVRLDGVVGSVGDKLDKTSELEDELMPVEVNVGNVERI